MTLFEPSTTLMAGLRKSPKTVLITGGSSGIGLATAILLSSLNSQHNLILLDLQSPSASLQHDASRVLFCKCDITSWDSQRSAFEAGFSKFGRIDAVFVNAGISEYKDQFFTDILDAKGKLVRPDKRVLGIDLDAAADTTKLGIHYLRKNGPEGGSIVLTASLAGYLGSAGVPLYSAAKHGIVGLMRSLKQEIAKLNISMSVIAPAITVTPIIVADDANHPNTDQSAKLHADKLKEYGVPINKVESVAMAVCWLIDQGMKANGAGIFIQGDKYVDLERGLAKSRQSWMGQEMLDLFRGGRAAPLFTRLSEKRKFGSKL